MEVWGWLSTAYPLERKAWMDHFCASISGESFANSGARHG